MCSVTNHSERNNRVRFSDRSFMLRYDVLDAEGSSSWYSLEETRAFKQSLISDAVRLRNLVASAPNWTALSEEDVHEMVDLETFLSRSRARRAHARVRSHVALVVAEQASQAGGAAGDRSEERLSMVAQISSRPSRERAHVAWRRSSVNLRT